MHLHSRKQHLLQFGCFSKFKLDKHQRMAEVKSIRRALDLSGGVSMPVPHASAMFSVRHSEISIFASAKSSLLYRGCDGSSSKG